MIAGGGFSDGSLTFVEQADRRHLQLCIELNTRINRA
jgi:hypothetical protein